MVFSSATGADRREDVKRAFNVGPHQPQRGSDAPLEQHRDSV
jgi:hypothetical protein